jgi:hypothetical protein
VEYEKEVHYKETGRRLVHVIYTPDRDELGHLVGWVASIIDVTNAADLHSTMILRDVSSDCVRDDATLDYCLHRILDAGITIAKAQKGTLQLLDPLSGTLRIATQRGFGQPLLDFFKDVSPESSTCGAALQTGGRIFVENVLTSEIFVGQPSQEVLLNEDVSAVISTPLISSHRHLLGMLSTHFREPHQPQGRELHLTDLLNRLAPTIWNASRGAKAKDYFFGRYNIVATICSVSCRRFPRTPSLALSHSVKRKEHLKVDFLLWQSAIS